MDPLDREIVQLLQQDATLSVREVGEVVGLSTTPCWRRIQALEKSGVIDRRVAIVDPVKVNLSVSALVLVRTNEHNKDWLDRFVAAIDQFPEIIEAYRTSGEIDYLLKVMVPDIAAYDEFYKKLIEQVDLYNVRTTFIMEPIKHTTALPLHYTG